MLFRSLTFWKNPKSVNRRVARWFAILQDYNLQIKHVPGKLHAAADMLSRPPSEDKGEKDNADLTLLPPQIFVRTTNSPWDRLLQDICEAQLRHRSLMEDWKRSKEVTQDNQVAIISFRFMLTFRPMLASCTFHSSPLL